MSRENVKTILERPTCSVDEFAEIMGISRNPAYEAVKRGDVPSIRIGNRSKYPPAKPGALSFGPLKAA